LAVRLTSGNAGKASSLAVVLLRARVILREADVFFLCICYEEPDSTRLKRLHRPDCGESEEYEQAPCRERVGPSDWVNR
jgi:hypothetical protein